MLAPSSVRVNPAVGSHRHALENPKSRRRLCEQATRCDEVPEPTLNGRVGSGNTAARFCGVVTGLYDYSNSGGGTGHTADIVGMFDLPESKALIAAVVIFAVSIPITRWAVRGGVPTIADRLGQSALKQLDLPSGVAPAVEKQLDVIADQLRPACAPSTRSFRLLLAHYADVRSFSERWSY
jgi:hypothetical protein